MRAYLPSVCAEPERALPADHAHGVRVLRHRHGVTYRVGTVDERRAMQEDSPPITERPSWVAAAERALADGSSSADLGNGFTVFRSPGGVTLRFGELEKRVAQPTVFADEPSVSDALADLPTSLPLPTRVG